MSTKDDIISALMQRSLTLRDLTTLLKKSPSGIRGRISELRHAGYDIQKINNKYNLMVSSHNTPDYKLIHYIDANQLYGKILNYNNLALTLSLTPQQISDGFAKLFSMYNITQISKDSCIIKKP